MHNSTSDGASDQQQKQQKQESSAMTPGQILRQNMGELSDYEQSEILEYKKIYFFGPHAVKLKATPVIGGYHCRRSCCRSRFR